MKKQILSAVLLAAMVGVSVAEANFTDALREKYAGKDALTVKYTVMGSIAELKKMGRLGEGAVNDPRAERAICGWEGDKEYLTIEYPIYETGRTLSKGKKKRKEYRMLTKYGTYREANKPHKGTGSFLTDVLSNLSSGNGPYDAQIRKNGVMYKICYPDENEKSVLVKKTRGRGLLWGDMPDLMKGILSGVYNMFSYSRYNITIKLDVQEIGRVNLLGKEYIEEDLFGSVPGHKPDKTYSYCCKLFYDEQGNLAYFTNFGPLSKRGNLYSDDCYALSSISASFDNDTYDKLDKYYNDFVSNKKKEE